MSSWFHPSGALARDGWDVRVGWDGDTWRYTGLRVGSAGEWRLAPGAVERMVVPLDAGAVTVEHEGGQLDLIGRASVFDGAADVAYLGAGASAHITATGRFAVAEAPAHRQLPTSLIRAGDVPVEHRGDGATARRVHNFGTPGALEAERLIVCEVITPAGNWSSYPPHKHDEDVPGRESQLEEIYWFEGTGFFSAHSSPGHDISLSEVVRTGDVALIPWGFHGPAAAAPGNDLYYLNVMAGPSGRSWLITPDDWEARQ